MPTSTRWRHRHTDVACDLGGMDRTAQARAWRDLRLAWGLRAERIERGARLHLRRGCERSVRDLVASEARCCGFLDFALIEGDVSVRLDITSPAPGGERVAVELAGVGVGVGVEVGTGADPRRPDRPLPVRDPGCRRPDPATPGRTPGRTSRR